MAAIDHTVMVFKNGIWMKDQDTLNENGEFIDHCPFMYGRDGNIHMVNDDDIWTEITWYRDEYDAIYQRDGARGKYARLLARIKWWLHITERVGYEKEVGVWKKDNIELYIYRDPRNQCYVSFYKDTTDTYIVLGGYGHHANVYTHFMGRGYGDEFEEKMAYEAYEWCVDDVLVEVAESIYKDFWVNYDAQKALQRTFGVGLKEDSWLRGRVYGIEVK